MPDGVYDLGADTGWASVGNDGALPRSRWRPSAAGGPRWPARRPRRDETADHRGRGRLERLPTRSWKKESAALAEDIGTPITVRHMPPGTSKWNRIEYGLFSHISTNWAGQPRRATKSPST